MSNELDQTDLTVFICLLKLSKKIDRFASSLTVLSLALSIALLLSADNIVIAMFSIVLVVLGLIEKYFAIRVDFDHSLFKHLQKYAEADLPNALIKMDQSLCRLGLLNRGYDPLRSLDSRMKGAIGLLKKQLFCGTIQSIFLLVGLLIIVSF